MGAMARDLFAAHNRCQYCGQPGSVVWDADLVSCGHELCKTLAFAELKRRRRNVAGPAPGKGFAVRPRAGRVPTGRHHLVGRAVRTRG